MLDGLGNAIKHQNQANTCIKQHAKPCPRTELGFAVGSTQSNIFETTKPKVQAKQEDQIYRQYIKPSEFCGDKRLYYFKSCAY